MNDEPTSSPEPSSSNPPSETAPRSRRISTPRPRKAAAIVEAPVARAKAAAPTLPAPPTDPPTEAAPLTAAQAGDWPDPEPASSGVAGSPENPKRKRRRKKGKGGNGPQASTAAPPAEGGYPAAAPVGDPAAEAAVTSGPAAAPSTAAREQAAARTRIDPELLARRAWKIYLAEISEEGVALVGDHDAKELARRCFRLAEIFIDEQSHRR